jgi:hypothetical protein
MRATRVTAAFLVMIAGQASGEGLRVRLQPRASHPDLQYQGPRKLEALPGGECADISQPNGATCRLQELSTLGHSRWYWVTETATSEGSTWSAGQLIEVLQSGTVFSVLGVQLEGVGTVGDAALLRHGSETYLHVPVRYSGTGALSDDILLHWRKDHWQEVDTRSWWKDIVLPPCYGLWKGPFLDFAALSLDMAVWIEGDGNCCPTGGRLKVTFRIRKDRLTLRDWHHIHSDDEGSPWDPGRGIDASRPVWFEADGPANKALNLTSGAA